MSRDRAVGFVLLGMLAAMVVVACLLGFTQDQWTIALPLLAMAAAFLVVALASMKKKTNG